MNNVVFLDPNDNLPLYLVSQAGAVFIYSYKLILFYFLASSFFHIKTIMCVSRKKVLYRVIYILL